MSPGSANRRAKFTSFRSSPSCNLIFSNITASPSFILLRLSAIKLKSVAFIKPNGKDFSALFRYFATEAKDPFLPGLKWLIIITLAPFWLKYSMVGIVLFILYKSSTFPSLNNTLKSTRKRTRFPFTSASLTLGKLIAIYIFGYIHQNFSDKDGRPESRFRVVRLRLGVAAYRPNRLVSDYKASHQILA